MRVGIPHTGGALLAHARARQHPILVSANAFARFAPRGRADAGAFLGFKRDLQAFQGLDVALDSAGFVSAQLGDYRWPVEAYVELAAALRPTWYAAPDYCMEPEVAADKATRMLRLAGTAHNYARCARLASKRGINAPMPVIQGWELGDYLRCIEWLPVFEWPQLVGIGSMCRRPIEGPNGVIAIVNALADVLPSHCRFHLFGVKQHPLVSTLERVASVDSMAWDAAARAERRTGRTMEFRIGHMERWLARQHTLTRQRMPPLRIKATATCSGEARSVREIVGERLAARIMDDDIEYSGANVLLEYGSCWGSAYAQQQGLSAVADRATIEAFLDDNCM